jgi:hypothetical protein
MRESVDDYVGRCDKCQKGKYELWAPLGEVEDLRTFPGCVNGHYGPWLCDTPKHICWPSLIISQSMSKPSRFRTFRQKLVRVYTTQIMARHGSGSTLIKGGFSPRHFSKRLKILGVGKVRTSPYNAMSNGMVEIFHTVRHGSIAHYIDPTGRNWGLCIYVNTLMEENAQSEHTPSTVLVGRLVDGDVVDNVLTSCKKRGGQDRATWAVTATHSNNGKFVWCKYLNICYIVAGLRSISADNAISNTEIH